MYSRKKFYNIGHRLDLWLSFIQTWIRIRFSLQPVSASSRRETKPGVNFIKNLQISYDKLERLSLASLSSLV